MKTVVENDWMVLKSGRFAFPKIETNLTVS